MNIMGINVYWKRENSDEEKCTFIMAMSHETACQKVQQIKGADIQLLRSQTYDRTQKCLTGEPIYYNSDEGC
ncbi:MAG: hypothetical protein HDR02_00280 [Lachnospiraceae bacterium]|nr:hypothetical protein [Lachnospiraceae bacterium]